MHCSLQWAGGHNVRWGHGCGLATAQAWCITWVVQEVARIAPQERVQRPLSCQVCCPHIMNLTWLQRGRAAANAASRGAVCSTHCAGASVAVALVGWSRVAQPLGDAWCRPAVWSHCSSMTLLGVVQVCWRESVKATCCLGCASSVAAYPPSCSWPSHCGRHPWCVAGVCVLAPVPLPSSMYACVQQAVQQLSLTARCDGRNRSRRLCACTSCCYSAMGPRTCVECCGDWGMQREGCLTPCCDSDMQRHVGSALGL